MPPKCSICTDPKANQVNISLGKGVSFRNIAKQTLKDESRYTSIFRHTHNCLKLDVQAVIELGLLDSKVEVYKEFQEQLAFAKQLRQAAKDYLSDPDTNEIELIPHSNEIDVFYRDMLDTTKDGKPKKKRAVLQALLDRLDSNNKQPIAITSKHVDIRSFALDAIKTADSTLDKFAKIDGEYTDNKQNPETIARQQEAIKQTVLAMLDEGVDRDEIVNLVAEAAVEEFVN